MTSHKAMTATLLAGVAFAAFPGMALAQDTEASRQDALGVPTDCTPDDARPECSIVDAAPTAAEDTPAVIITGSRIARPNLESTVPVTTLQGEEFFETGQVAIGDVLNELPALRSTFSQSNSTRFLGTAGLNLLDLRGLGTSRTLVLVNGRRHVGSDILNNGVGVDTNTIPTDLIERTDVVTGGNSAIYGSDAIAGVVNFVLKRDFDGFQVRGQGGVSSYGDAGAYFASALAGRNFADGRGNIAVNAEYAHQSQYFGSGRPYLARQDGFVTVDTDPAGTLNGSDGNPDRVFFRDIRSSTYTNTGLVPFGGNARVNGGTDASGNFFVAPYLFLADGALVPVTGTRVGLAPNGSFIGGNGTNFRESTLLQIQPKQDRYNLNVLGHFTFSDAFEPFFEAKYVRTDVTGTGGSGPAFISGGVLGDTRERPRLDNPFLSDQARATIVDLLTRSSATGTAPAANSRFTVRENLINLGNRTEQSKRETYRGVLGIRGSFNDDWSYELAGTYGEFKEKTKVLGNLNVQRFLLAVDPARNGAGQIVCRSQIDPAARNGYIDEGAIFDADVAACVPINIFGGQFTQAQRDYVLLDSTSIGKITQLDISGFVSGDSSQLFELPGGPIGFAIGGEYRRETNFYVQDPLVAAGYTFYNSIPRFDPPSFEVKEAFGEIRIPLIADRPFFQELTLSGAGRVSDYKGNVGTTFAYNGGVDYSPFDGLRFRGNYSRSVRAPNLTELFTPPGQNFAPGFNDPCSARNIGTGTANRAANCRAAGVPAGYDFVYSSSLEIVSGGNPALNEEKSDSYTVGGVFTPRFLPGFSLTVDYFDITVNDVISSVSAQTIADQCYDQASLNNAFCGLFQRAGAGGGPNGEVPFQILEGNLLQSSLNFAKLQVRGIDTEVSYVHRFGDNNRISSRLTYTHTFANDSFLNPSDPNFKDVQLLELGDPKNEFLLNNALKLGDYTLGYQLRYIGKQVLNNYEDLFGVQGRPPQNKDYADIDYYPETFYHDVRFSVDATDKFNFYVGADNVLNTKPPLGLTGIGGGSGIYNVRGRYFYAGAVAKF